MAWVGRGHQILDFMRRELVHAEGDRYGKPFVPPKWLEQAVTDTYVFDDVTWQRRVDRVLCGLPKGCAKTEGAAAWALIELIGPVVGHPGMVDPLVWGWPRESPNVPIGAASYDQARLCFGAAAIMVKESKNLSAYVDVYENRIELKNRPGRLYRIAAEAGTNDGTLPTAFIADEVHEWVGRKRRVHTVVGNSLRKRAGGLEINISTAGDPVQSELLHNLYEYGRKVAGGEIDDPRFLHIWKEADPSLDLSDRDQLLEATRQAYELAPWIDVERVADRFYQIPEHEYRRYHLNQWVTGGDSFLPAGVWDDCAAPVALEAGTDVVLAFDGSHNGDSTALYGCTLDSYVFEVGVWERPENAHGWKVPRSEVDAAVDEAFRDFNVLEMHCDPARWALYIDSWAERYGDDRVLEFPQSRARMAPATSKFYDAVVNKLLTHDGSVTLARHLANAVIKQFPGGYVLVKDHPNRKIDAAVAAVMAHDRATVRRESDVVDRVNVMYV